MFDAADIVVDDRDTWCSPQEIVDALLRLWPDGPDLDPCTNERSIVPYRRRYTLADCVDVADQTWTGRVYCNPPFSNTGPWAAKMALHLEGVVGCVLCDPSVSWWRDIWTADVICFPDHRVKFIGPSAFVNDQMATRRSSSFDRPIALPFWLPIWRGAGPEPAWYEGLRGSFERAFGTLGKVVHL